MRCLPAFYEMGKETCNGMEYPVLLLDDIKIHCNHATDPAQAISDRIRRSKKINWNNILVEMCTEDAMIEKNFLELEMYKKKICFVAHPSQHKGAFELKLSSGQKIWGVVNEYARYGSAHGLAINLVELLNKSGE